MEGSRNSPLGQAQEAIAATSRAFVVRLTAFVAGLNTGIVGFAAASLTVVCSRASLALAMPRHFGSVSDRSAVPGIVVLRKTPDDVSQFVKQYRNLRLRSIPAVRRDHQQTIAAGLK